MTTAEILLRLLGWVLCWFAGAALILPVVSERHGPLAVVLVLVAGTTAVAVGAGWPHVRGGDRD